MIKKFAILFFIGWNSICFSQNWKTNLEEAQKVAQAEDKNILLVFSGSDWCGPCIKLDKKIWQSAEFKKESDEKWILVKADFPKKKVNQLSNELTASNKKLAEKYNKEGYFPLVLLLDKEGYVLGKTGYANHSPEGFIKLIHSLKK